MRLNCNRGWHRFMWILLKQKRNSKFHPWKRILFEAYLNKCYILTFQHTIFNTLYCLFGNLEHEPMILRLTDERQRQERRTLGTVRANSAG